MARILQNFLCFATVLISENILVKALSNVALGKPAYQSSTYIEGYNIFSASLSVDGNTDGSKYALSCSHTAEEKENEYWEVDLGEIYSIDHVIVFNRLDCCSNRTRNVQVLVGFDQNDYELSGYLEGLLGSQHTFQMDSHTYGRWVRITRNEVIDFINICEVEVYGELLTMDKVVRFEQLTNKIGVGAVLGVKRPSSKGYCTAYCKTVPNCAGFNFDSSNLECTILESASTNDTLQDGLSFFRKG